MSSRISSKTAEQIKDEISMPDLLERFGIEIKKGFCHCPFHGDDKHASMKVYPKAVHCYTCQYHGDIFDFYGKMNGCDFKTSFKALGGAYEEYTNDYSAELSRDKWQREKLERENKEQAEKAFFKKLRFTIEICRHADEIFEIFSDEWCYLINQRDWLEYCYDLKYIEGKEINEIDVIRVCGEIRRKVYPV